MENKLKKVAEEHWNLAYCMSKSEEIRPYVVQDFSSGAIWLAEQLREFLHNEIIERRDYSASKSFEIILSKIEELI